MSEPDSSANRVKPARTVALPRRLWRLLCSLKLAVALMGLIAAACIVGTLIEQGSYDLDQAVARYGKRLGLLVGLLDLNRLYEAPWFLGLLALFALCTTACALSRLRFRLRSLGSAVVHLSILFIVAGALARGLAGLDGYVTIQEGDSLDSFETRSHQEALQNIKALESRALADPKSSAAVREACRQKRLKIEAEPPVPLGFELRLDRFQVVRNADAANGLLIQFKDDAEPKTLPVQVGKVVPVRPDGTTVEVLQYLPHFMMDGSRIYSKSDKPVNPAIQVRITGPFAEADTPAEKGQPRSETRWLFVKFPEVHNQSKFEGGPALRFIQSEGSIKSFESHVTISGEPGREPRTATIRVNQPLRAGRFVLYQTSYDQTAERASSTLEVTYDPGVPLVFIGFILMPLGMAFVFYVQPFLKGRRRAQPDGKADSAPAPDASPPATPSSNDQGQGNGDKGMGTGEEKSEELRQND